jgi:hypothetical protein
VKPETATPDEFIERNGGIDNGIRVLEELHNKAIGRWPGVVESTEAKLRYLYCRRDVERAMAAQRSTAGGSGATSTVRAPTTAAPRSSTGGGSRSEGTPINRDTGRDCLQLRQLSPTRESALRDSAKVCEGGNCYDIRFRVELSNTCATRINVHWAFKDKNYRGDTNSMWTLPPGGSHIVSCLEVASRCSGELVYRSSTGY